MTKPINAEEARAVLRALLIPPPTNTYEAHRNRAIRACLAALDALPDAGGQGWTRVELTEAFNKTVETYDNYRGETFRGVLSLADRNALADIALSRPSPPATTRWTQDEIDAAKWRAQEQGRALGWVESPPITEAGYEAAARVLQQRFRSLYGGDRAVAADALDIARQMVDAATKTREG